LGKLVTEGSGSHVDTVMLVSGLGKALLIGKFGDGFLVGNDGVTLLEGNLGVFLLEILKANLDMELTATGNNVLTRFLSCADDERVGFGKLTESIDELGQVRGVLDLDGDTHDGGDRELHHTDAASFFVIRDGTLLDKVSINTDETDGVTARNIGDSLDLTSHHENGTLDVLDVQVSLGSGNVVGAHNADTLSSAYGTGENATKGVETTRLTSGHHLGDEDHKGTVGVASLDSLTASIIDGTLVKVSGTVVLGLTGRGELHDNHLNKSLSGVNPLLANVLHEGLEAEFLLVVLHNEAEGLNHLPDGIEVAFHDIADHLDDGAHDELDEAAGELLTLIIGILGGELLALGVKVLVSPELLHELLDVKLELGGVNASEAGKGEGPTVKGGTEGDATVTGVNLHGFAHIVALVGGDNDVGVLNDTLEVLVHGLTINLQFHDTTINLVNEKNGLDLFTEGLTEHGLGLNADTFDVIDDDEGTISDTEGSSDFSGEINVTG
jgi:hypothetical protein